MDSQDLSLNISREMLQHDRQLKLIAGNLEKKIKALAKSGTTQLRPDLAMKEALECSTMRVRGAHFAPIPTTSPENLENENDCNAVIKTDDFNFFFAGENGAEGGEEE